MAKVKYVFYGTKCSGDSKIEFFTTRSQLKNLNTGSNAEPILEVDERTIKRWKKTVRNYEKLQHELWQRYHSEWRKIGEAEYANSLSKD